MNLAGKGKQEGCPGWTGGRWGWKPEGPGWGWMEGESTKKEDWKGWGHFLVS